MTQAVKFHLKPSMQVLDCSSLKAAKNKHTPTLLKKDLIFNPHVALMLLFTLLLQHLFLWAHRSLCG